jgi:hypothetical protein
MYGEVLCQVVLTDEAEFIERLGRGSLVGIERVAAHTRVEIAGQVIDEGLFDAGPLLTGLAAGEHVKVTLVTVEFRLGTCDQILFYLLQHAAQRITQAPDSEIAAIVDHPPSLGRHGIRIREGYSAHVSPLRPHEAARKG